MSKTVRTRKGWFGVAVMQEAVLDGTGQIAAWRDMKHRGDTPFMILPQSTMQTMQSRIAEAEKRAAIQRKARKDKKDFENSRLA